MKMLRRVLDKSMESLLDQALAEIDRLISPCFYDRLKATNPELSARIGEQNRNVSTAYRGGEIEGLRAALDHLKELYYQRKYAVMRDQEGQEIKIDLR